MTDIYLFQKFILGVVQGLAEFLPVSSSAHLILIPRLFHWTDFGLAFDVSLHLGTLAAVIVYYWKDLWKLAVSIIKFSDPSLAGDRRLVGYLILATIPGALVGLALEHKVETVFRSPFLVAWTLMGLAIALYAADRFLSGDKKLSDITWRTALVLGVAQSLAIVPGISRSGITITVALALSFSRKEAARFSFLMSVPIIAGAGLLKAPEIFRSPDQLGILVGFLSAAVTGFLAIWVLIRYVQTHRYTPFVLYRLALGLFILFNLSKFH